MEWKVSSELVPYPQALEEMEARANAIAAGEAEECVWLLEHPPLYTGGTSSKDTDLLEARFPVYQTGRGGEYTYHGPGQRVAYVMLDLRKRQREPDLKKYVWQLEECIILTLSALGIIGERRQGRVGIWVDHQGQEKKIAAIGVRIRKWVTFHGIAINLDPDLSHYGGIVPCGISEFGVTSIHQVSGRAVDPVEVDDALKRSWGRVFDAERVSNL